MTKRDLAAIGVRLMAILAVLYAVNSLTYSLNQLLSYALARGTAPGGTGVLDVLLGGGAERLIFVLGPFLALCCLSAMLWLFADAFAYFIAGREERDAPSLQIALSAQDAFTVALLVLGVYLLFTGVPSLVAYVGSSLFPGPFAGPQPVSGSGFNTLQLLLASVHLASGLLLIFGARWVAASIPAMRAMMADPAAAAGRVWRGPPDEPREPDADL